MRKTNVHQLMEVICDLMSDNGITLRQFNNHFYDSRIHNQDSMLSMIELLTIDIKNKRVIDSKNLHPDLFKTQENNKCSKN